MLSGCLPTILFQVEIQPYCLKGVEFNLFGTTGLAKQVIAHVDAFLARQNPMKLRRIFNRYSCPSAAAGSQPVIGHERLRQALEELHILVLEDTVDELFATMDTDGNGAVDFNEFIAAVAQLSKVEQWTSGIAVHRLLASALSPIVLAHTVAGERDVLRSLSRSF